MWHDLYQAGIAEGVKMTTIYVLRRRCKSLKPEGGSQKTSLIEQYSKDKPVLGVDNYPLTLGRVHLPPEKDYDRG